MNNRKQVERIKERYPVGTRIELLSTMDDIQGVDKGIKGTVVGVDDMGTIHMKWDNGRGLGLIPGEDNFIVLSRPKENSQEQEQSENQGMGGMTQ